MRGVLADAARLCPGTLEALLVDADGVLLEHHGEPGGGLDPEEIGVEVTTAIPTLARVGAASRLGGIREWLVVGDRGVLLIRRVPGLRLLVVLRIASGTWVGRGRFAARVTAGRIAERLSR
ncbi:MAG: hypothetical protein KBD01_05475 [Acidobacteria bacterium]|nr:hypothetical protein [Acidobacteriota bacterium]